MNKSKFLHKLLEVLEMVPEGVAFTKKEASILLPDGKPLISISSAGINMPGVAMPTSFFGKPSPLKDSFVPTEQIKEIFQYLIKNNLFKGLNHLGFGYSVESAKTEKERLINEAKKAKLHLYEEVSNEDGSVWLFLRGGDDWQTPMVEFVINEKTTDKWKDYWLPHFQIDIDTYLDGDEIESLITDSFKGKVKPFRIVETKDNIILVRARLGIVSGINIALDMGFEGRMPRWHREKLMNKLV